MAQGVIYILTNPSFPEYVKIGYAAKLEERLRQLNRAKKRVLCDESGRCLWLIRMHCKDKWNRSPIEKVDTGRSRDIR